MSRYFDTVIKAFVDESKVDFNNKERFIEDRETDLQVAKYLLIISPYSLFIKSISSWQNSLLTVALNALVLFCIAKS